MNPKVRIDDNLYQFLTKLEVYSVQLSSLCIKSSSFATFLTTYLFIIVLFLRLRTSGKKMILSWKISHTLNSLLNQIFWIKREICRIIILTFWDIKWFWFRSIWHGVIKMMASQSHRMHTYDANNIYLVNLKNYLQGHDDTNKVRMS